MIEDEWCRNRLRGMLVDFYKDVAKAGFFEKEDTTSVKEFYEFVDKWVEEHFMHEE